MSRNRLEVLLTFLLIGATLVALGNVCRNQFIEYDDDRYVTDNRHVQEGLTGPALWWSCTNTSMANWHPLTWISFQLDYRIFGNHAWGFHFTNLLLHIINVVLLFLMLRRWTGDLWPSALAAGLFAVHPLHVESVAWVAERKDVLSTLFGMLTLWFYLNYARRPAWPRYLLVIIVFALGLMAKSMLVTLPFVLLLLDFWPLGRLSLGARLDWVAQAEEGQEQTKHHIEPVPWRQLIGEKLPLIALAMASSFITMIAQREGGEVNRWREMPLRLENAVVAYVEYLGKTCWPRSLVPFYPFPQAFYPLWQMAGAVLILAALTLLALRTTKRRPYLLVGWLWYVGTLIPVIGIVQVLGGHGMADRYTYIPLIGLFVMVAWGLADVAGKWPGLRFPIAALSIVILTACIFWTRIQVGYWHDNLTLWEHALQVSENNYVGHNSVGVSLMKQGHNDEALPHFSEALRIRPDYAESYNNRGVILSQQGQFKAAVRDLAKTVQLSPGNPEYRTNLAHALLKQGNLGLALQEFRAALKIDPESAQIHNGLGEVFSKQGNLDFAEKEFREALRLYPKFADAHGNLAIVLKRQGKLEDAIRHYGVALALDPNHAAAHNNLGVLYAQQRQWDEASRHLGEAVRITPDDGDAWHNLGLVQSMKGDLTQAIQSFRHAVARDSANALFRYNLAFALAEGGEKEAAKSQYQEARRLDPLWPRRAQDIAWNLATHPDPGARDSAMALRLARQSCQAEEKSTPRCLDTLAAALAATGSFTEAIVTADQALKLAAAQKSELVPFIQERQRLYSKHQAYRAPSPGQYP